MKKTPLLLKNKVKLLEEKLKKKDDLLQKYKQSLKDSNNRIKKITKNLDSSISLVRDIHKNLIPVRLPHIPGFEFSFKFLPTRYGISGDFFNVIKIKDTMSFGILLSNCSTYMVSSLFLSSFLKFSPELKSYQSAKDFFSFTAKNISSSLNKKEKVNLFYGLISRSSFELDYCLAGDIFVGHKSQGGKFDVLPAHTSSLIQKNKFSFKSGRCHLNSKDILLLCSPGIAGRVNKKGKVFGTQRIIQAAKKKSSEGVLEIRQNVLFSCNEFSDTPSTQDATVLAIKVADRILKAHKPS